MNSNSTKQRGQALILIVLAIVGMIGLTGLAIDGGNAYSDRRHAQNAADTASMAAALAKIRGRDWLEAGKAQAEANGYLRAGSSSTVRVELCSTATAPACVLAPGETTPANYIQVVVTSTIPTYFGPVVGIRHVTNTVQAISKAVAGSPTPWVSGNALVALMPGCPSGGSNNHDPFDFAGSETSIVNGTGIFVNSRCNPAFVDNGASNQMTVPQGVCVVGGVGAVNGVGPTPPQANCGSQIDLNMYQMPPLDEHSCDLQGAGTVQNMGSGIGEVFPGNFSGPFPPSGYSVYRLHQGIYCLTGGIQLTGGLMTTDWNHNNIYDVNSEGALFYIRSGDVAVGGNASVYLHAITTSSTGLGPDLVGYLLYMPATNGSNITLTGSSSSQYVGTILAPGSFVTLNGGNAGDSLNLDAQIIGYALRLTGSGNLNITYNQSHNATTYTNPELTQYK